MRYRSLEDALLDLEHAGMLSRVKTEVDPFLEMSAIAKENFEANGPALLFEKVKALSVIPKLVPVFISTII